MPLLGSLKQQLLTAHLIESTSMPSVLAVCMLCRSMNIADRTIVTASALTSPLLANAEHDVHISKVQPLKGIGAAEDIAKIAVVLGSDDCTWMTGAALPVDGGFLCQ